MQRTGLITLISLISLFGSGSCMSNSDEFTLLDKVTARFNGPLHLRFILQPVIAVTLGMKDGRRDFLHNSPPYLRFLVFNDVDRWKNFKEGLKSISKVLIIGVILDLVVQVYLFEYAKLIGALSVGVLIIALPYAISRSLINHLGRRLRNTRDR